jgi:hypothetical protein|tara:strand:+ start:5135 stop:5488 length:354 start_codon:yes stop_codon:yes gene_type:complete
MKLTELKKVLKETVREVIQEELKDILLEAVKTPKVITQSPIMESFTPLVPSPTPTTPIMSSQDKRDAYKNILGETAAGFNTNNAQSFKPNPGMDVTNGALPEGNVGMDQIMNLMNTK